MGAETHAQSVTAEPVPAPLNDPDTARLSPDPTPPRVEGSSLAFRARPHLGRPSGGSMPRVPPSLALQWTGTHKRLRTMAPAKAMSRKKGREPRMDVTTIIPPLLRPGHVSIAAYGVADRTQARLLPRPCSPQPSPRDTRGPPGLAATDLRMKPGPGSESVSPQVRGAVNL